MNSDSQSALLTYLTQQITLYCPIIIITMGNIGCLCNFITFTSIKLRKTSCSLYFFAAAIFDLLTLDFGTLTRLLADHFGYILFKNTTISCYCITCYCYMFYCSSNNGSLYVHFSKTHLSLIRDHETGQMDSLSFSDYL
jgi:hypothetical protein